MRNKIELVTMKDINDFVGVCNSISEKVYLTDGKDFTVSAKSLLGAIASMEWDEIYVACERNIYHLIERWVE